MPLWYNLILHDIDVLYVLGFNGAETNCRIAHVLGILLMISYWFAFYFSDIIVVCTVSISIMSNSGYLELFLVSPQPETTVTLK